MVPGDCVLLEEADVVDAPTADLNDDGMVNGDDIAILTPRLGTQRGEEGYLDGLDIAAFF